MRQLESSWQPHGVRRTLSLWGFFNVGFGAVIGSCWLLLVGDWMVRGGGPTAVIVAFLLGMLLMLPVASVFGEIAAAVPFAGGPAQVVAKTYGERAAFVAEWAFVLGNGVVPLWDALMVSYIVSHVLGALPDFGWVNAVCLYEIAGSKVYLVPALCGMVAPFVVGSLGLRNDFSAERLQSLLSALQLFGMIVVLAVAAFYGSADNALPTFAVAAGSPAGVTDAHSLFDGVLSVLVITPFFYAGFDAIPQRANEAAEGVNWNKFGKVIVLTLLASAGFYIVTTYSFGTIVPWTTFVRYELPAFAVLRSTNLVAFMAVVIVAMFCPLGPMNSFIGATASVLAAMAQRGRLPRVVGQVDPKTGTYRMAYLVVFVVAMVGPLLGAGLLAPLSRVASLALSLSYLMTSLACLHMRVHQPELRRPFKVPGGTAGIVCSCVTSAFCVALMVLPISPAALSPYEWAIVGAWVVFALALALLEGRVASTVQTA